MGTNEIVGLALLVAGISDAAVAVFLLGPRIPDENRRRIVVGAVLSGGAMMILLGAAFALGVLDLEGTS